MSEKDIERFDQQLRAMLEDASEEVPEGVWEGVSARLGRRLLWRRIAVASSVAAALVAGVFVLGIGNSNNQDKVNVLAETEVPAEESVHAEEVPMTDATIADSGLIADTAPQKQTEGKNGYEAVKAVTVPMEVTDVAMYDTANAEDGEDAESLIGVEATEGDATAEAEQEEMTPEEEAMNAEGQSTGGEGKASIESETKTWSDIEREEAESEDKGASKFSLTASSNVMSNGDAEAMSSFRVMRANGSGSGTYIRQTNPDSDTYSVPMTFGLGIRYQFAPRWSVGTGITYSLMERTFAGQYTQTEGGVDIRSYNGDIRSTLHYIGIPLEIYYDIIDNRKIRVYGFAGGSVEKAIRNSYRMLDSEPFTYRESVDGVQASVGAGFGVEYLFTDFLGIYIDPSIRYFFDCDQPVSIRTQQPLMMSFEIGLRFDL